LIYYAAFIPGMQDFIADVLRERLKDVSIQKLLDGAVVFETECTYDRLNFFCFNNIFALIDIQEYKAENGQSVGPGVMELHINKILKLKSSGKILKSFHPLIAGNSKLIKSFRLVCSMENKPVSVNENIKKDMENFIIRVSCLKLNRSKPDTEFWFLYRREGFSCFLKRLTNNRQGEKSLHPGELRSQLAWLLCKIAGIKNGDTVVDPFCGYGSIPKAACKHFPVKKFYAFDIDPLCIKATRSQSGIRGKQTCEIHQSDFRSVFNFVTPGGIDVIVTDPPWGIYKETDTPLQSMYNEMLNVFSQLLKNKGRLVLLSAAERELEFAIEKNHTFTVNVKTPILVSGKKANLYRLEKN
jgi:predicted RNA methylase